MNAIQMLTAMLYRKKKTMWLGTVQFRKWERDRRGGETERVGDRDSSGF